MTLLSPTPALIAPVEMRVPGRSGRSWMLRADGRRVDWDGHTVALDAVTAVAYTARRRRRLVGRSRIERTIALWAGASEPLSIDLPGGTRTTNLEHAHRAAYAAVTAVIHAAVEPRLRAEMLRRMAIGERVMVGMLQMDTSGVRNASGFTSSWADLPVAAIEGDQVALTHRVECDVVSHHQVAANVPNAVLLPELFDEAAAAFS